MCWDAYSIFYSLFYKQVAQVACKMNDYCELILLMLNSVLVGGNCYYINWKDLFL